MLTRIFNWLGIGKEPIARSAPDTRAPEPKPAASPESSQGETFSPPVAGEASLIRNKYLREDTGTHETLKILDDSLIDSGEEEGFDPYNTGDFDRSQNWQRRFRS